MKEFWSSLLSLVLVFGGCTLMPDYKRPAAPVSTNWPVNATLDTGTNTVTAADLDWQLFFDDPRLQKLIEIALKNNRDLRIAALRVEQTRAQYRIQRAELYPGVQGDADFTRQRFSDAVTTFGGGSIFTTWNLDVGASYELDLFGRIRSLKREALEKYFSTEEARKSAQISLVAEVATEYLTQLRLREAKAVANQTLAAVKSSYDLIKQKFDVGAARDFYHHRGWCNGSGRRASIERKHGRTVYLKSVRNRRHLGVDESDVVSVGAPGVRIKIPAVFRYDPTIRQLHVQGCGKIRLA